MTLKTMAARLVGAATLSVGFGVLAAPAIAQTVEFRGGGYVSDFSPACREFGYTPNDRIFMTARLRPSGVGSNGPSTRLSTYTQFGAYFYGKPDGAFTRQFEPVIAATIFSVPSVFESGEVELRVTTQAPRNLDDSSQTVRLVGIVRGFEGLANCRVNFDFSMVRR